MGYEQVVPRGDDSNELGELLAHEIGHFLFNLTHYHAPSFENGQMIIRSKTDIMGERISMDPNDSIGELSQLQIEEAFNSGSIPRPSTSR